MAAQTIKQLNMQLPPYTKSQKQIILHLYKFHYLNINQIKLLMNYKEPKRVQEWPKDLRKKQYIYQNKNSMKVLRRVWWAI
jgi:hypothetical protein